MGTSFFRFVTIHVFVGQTDRNDAFEIPCVVLLHAVICFVSSKVQCYFSDVRRLNRPRPMCHRVERWCLQMRLSYVPVIWNASLQCH